MSLYAFYSERIGTAGRAFGAHGIQWRRQDDAVERADFQKRPERDGNRRQSYQRNARQQHNVDRHFRVRPTARPVHRHAHRPRTLGLPGEKKSRRDTS